MFLTGLTSCWLLTIRSFRPFQTVQMIQQLSYILCPLIQIISSYFGMVIDGPYNVMLQNNFRRVESMHVEKERMAVSVYHTVTTCRHRDRWPSCRNTSSKKSLFIPEGNTRWLSLSTEESLVGVWLFSKYVVIKVHYINLGMQIWLLLSRPPFLVVS